MLIEHIAKVVHQANKAYCETLEDFTQPDWIDAPGWIKVSILDGINYLAKLNYEMSVHDAAAESHENWCRKKIAEGWSYGEKKDVLKKTHPCLVSFSKLPPEQKTKNYLFLMIVLAMLSPYHNEEKNDV